MTGIPQMLRDVQASGTFFKPYIAMSNKYHMPIWSHSSENIKFTAHHKDNKYRYSDDIYSKPNENFNVMINEADSVPFTIDDNQASNIFTYMKKVIETQFNVKDPLLLEFCRITYDINFRQAFKITKNENLLSKVMEFACDFTTLESAWLHQEVKVDIACNYYYNIIKSMKYYMVGILNDINIYKQFNYFYIPKFMSYTGRLFSHPEFITMQGNKWAKNFIKFLAPVPEKINDEDFAKVTAYIATLVDYAAMDIDTTHGNPLKDMTLALNKQEMYVLFNKYLESFFSKTTEGEGESIILKYPYEASYEEQISWLLAKIKKPKEVMLVHGLFTAKYADKIHDIICQKDATCSVGQIAGGMLAKDEKISELTNLTSDEPRDIYAKVHGAMAHYIEERYKTFLRPIFEVLFKGYTIEDHLEYQIPFLSMIDPAYEIYKLLAFYISTDNYEYPNISEASQCIDLAMKIKHEVEEKQNQDIQHALDVITGIAFKDSPLLPIKVTSKSKLITYHKDRSRTSYAVVNSKTLIEYLKVIRSLYLMYKLEHKYQVRLLNRDVIKMLVMPDGYNAGEDSRKQSLRDYYTECLCKCGHSVLPKHEIEHVSNIVNTLYEIVSTDILKGIREFKTLTKEYVMHATPATNKHGIEIKMPYLTWTLHKHVNDPAKDKRCRITLNNGKSHFRLYNRTDVLDVNAMKTAFSPVFVHSIDALIVHNLIMKVSRINAFIKDNNLQVPFMRLHINHDTFGVNLFYAFYLKFFVADSYNHAVHLDYGHYYL